MKYATRFVLAMSVVYVLSTATTFGADEPVQPAATTTPQQRANARRAEFEAAKAKLGELEKQFSQLEAQGRQLSPAALKIETDAELIALGKAVDRARAARDEAVEKDAPREQVKPLDEAETLAAQRYRAAREKAYGALDKVMSEIHRVAEAVDEQRGEIRSLESREKVARAEEAQKPVIDTAEKRAKDQFEQSQSKLSAIEQKASATANEAQKQVAEISANAEAEMQTVIKKLNATFNDAMRDVEAKRAKLNEQFVQAQMRYRESQEKGTAAEQAEALKALTASDESYKAESAKLDAQLKSVADECEATDKAANAAMKAKIQAAQAKLASVQADVDKMVADAGNAAKESLESINVEQQRTMAEAYGKIAAATKLAKEQNAARPTTASATLQHYKLGKQLMTVELQRQSIDIDRAFLLNASVSAGEKIAALRPSEFKFDQIALCDVIDYFADITSVSYRVDWPALKAVGIDREIKVSYLASEIKPLEALRATLTAASGKTNPGLLQASLDGPFVLVSTDEGIRRWTVIANKLRQQLKGVNAFMLANMKRRLPEINFNGNNVSDVIDFLRNVTGVNIVVDWKNVEAAGTKKETPIDLRLRDIPFNQILLLVMAQCSSSIAMDVRNSAILISTEPGLAAMTKQLGQLAEMKKQLPQLDRHLLEVKLDGNPLGDVVDFYRDLTAMKINVDWVALEKAGITNDAPVMMRVRDLPAGDVIVLTIAALGIDEKHKIGLTLVNGELQIGPVK